MPNAYQITYDDPFGVEIRCDIVQDGETLGTSTVIDTPGRVSVEYADVDDPFQIIRPTTLSIELEAGTTNTYSELFSSSEREWWVELYRDSVRLFRGWLLPDGIFEDYVNENWVITLEAHDGLSDLQNRSYVNLAGGFYTGKVSLRTIMRRCLARTGISGASYYAQTSSTEDEFPIRYIFTTGPIDTDDYFDQTVDQRAFLNDDGDTAMSCAEVIEQILLPCNGYVFGWGGAWYINWSPQFANPTYVTDYRAYNSSGTRGTDITPTLEQTIGSEINGFSVHWVNKNQRIERRPALGSSRVVYNFLKVDAANTNAELENDGSTISGWTVSQDASSNDVVTLNTDDTVTIENGNQTSAVFESAVTPTDFDAGTIAEVYLKFSARRGTSDNVAVAQTKIQVVLDNGVTTYYLNSNYEWQTTSTTINLQVTRPPATYEVTIVSEPLPITGDVAINIWPVDDNSGNSLFADEMTFEFVGLANNDAVPAEGISYTAERPSAVSSYTEELKTGIIGDFTGIGYRGTLYWSNGTTDTDLGYATPQYSGVAETLYDTCVRYRLITRYSPSRVFSGDVYGYFPWRSQHITIDGFTDVVWALHGYTWDTFTGITSIKAHELHWGTWNSDIDTYKTVNFTNAVEPKIKG